MSKWKSPWVVLGVRNGAIAGVLGFLLWMGLYWMGRHPYFIALFFDFRLILFGFFIYYTLREIRDDHQEGILYFWQGMIATLFLTVAFVVVASLLLYIYLFIDTDFLTEYIRLKILELKSFPAEIVERLGKDTIDRNLEALPATNRADLVLIYVRQSLVISFFLSLILSVVLRRQPKF